MPLSFQCQKCKTEIVVKYSKIGEIAKCFCCGHENIVPVDAIQTEAEPTLPKFKLNQSITNESNFKQPEI